MDHKIDLSRSAIICGDAKEMLTHLPDNSVQLFVTSPPYNIGKSYEKNVVTLNEYRVWLNDILDIVFQKMKIGGSLCLQLGSHVKSGIATPLDYLFYPHLIDLGLVFRNRIVWRYNFGLNATRRFSGRYEVVLWFTKGGGYKFNLDPIRVPQLYPGKRHSARKGNRAGMPSGNPLGKNPSDYWEFDASQAFFGDPVWNIPNVKANHLEKVDGHPCQFPNELVERCVLALSTEGDLVVDPFAGTGTSAICAELHGRVGIGFELLADYAAQASDRLTLAKDGKLPIRASGKIPRVPKPTELVSMMPTEWKGEGGDNVQGWQAEEAAY